jgi:hypothetical protein
VRNGDNRPVEQGMCRVTKINEIPVTAAHALF